MKPEEIRDMSQRELRQKLEDTREQLFNTRFQIETRKNKNTSGIRLAKRDVARLMTALRERELMAAYGGVEFDEDAETTLTVQEQPRRRGLFGLRRGR